jgi:hypothetical protein
MAVRSIRNCALVCATSGFPQDGPSECGINRIRQDQAIIGIPWGIVWQKLLRMPQAYQYHTTDENRSHYKSG